MSIGIAVAIGDVVLMVADGRRSNAFSILTDQAEKIVDLNDSLVVIEFGAVMASTNVVDELRADSRLPVAGREFMDLLTRSIHSAGAFLVAAVIPDSTNLSRIKVGLLAGGVDADGAYIGGALFGHGMSEPSRLLLRPNSTPQFIVLGGETCGAQEYFEREIGRAYRASGTDRATLISMLKRAAKKTVRYAATHDNTIGGRVQYRILQPEHPTQSGFL
ncbi:hypothetical protein RY831_15220 [Noviherbaspirillum sp. CPCC 100848]|uniref:Proteasome subunit beta n=1 Tax=Noviherbaspirillum album TaxID=3080276 RepID=A0ABU6JA34_9BURK|nr:hypothetical protein [Noviherbaspirillum sp. CPCC 100848]MEC4720512.1 hypothetical protein [Noviherbaspirillum sp. CPCC 100848]